MVLPSRSSAARAQSASSWSGRHSGAGTPRAKEIVDMPSRLAGGGQVDDESRAARLPRLVAQVTAVGARVRAGDREPEPGSRHPVARHAGAREALEQCLLDLER